jgi:site-specific DNA recombinase
VIRLRTAADFPVANRRRLPISYGNRQDTRIGLPTSRRKSEGRLDSSRRVARLQKRQQAASQVRAAVAMKAAGYIRVSGDEQAAHGFGLEIQEKAIRAFAESQGYELVALASDPAVSGATRPSQRKGFGELVALAAAGGFSILLVWKFDRLARHIVFAVTAVDELSERYGVMVRSVTEPIDTSTPMGRTIFAVLAGMAEAERAAITERTWHGRREKATTGGFAGGAAPYGYSKGAEGRLGINPNEAEVVREIFALNADKIPYAEIARRLNAAGRRTRRNAPWRHGGIAYIVDNPKYRGFVEYLFRAHGDTHVLRDGAHAAIVGPGAESPMTAGKQ